MCPSQTASPFNVSEAHVAHADRDAAHCPAPHHEQFTPATKAVGDAANWQATALESYDSQEGQSCTDRQGPVGEHHAQAPRDPLDPEQASGVRLSSQDEFDPAHCCTDTTQLPGTVALDGVHQTQPPGTPAATRHADLLVHVPHCTVPHEGGGPGVQTHGGTLPL